MNVALDAPTRPALRYYGGKWKLAPWIISHFPEHKNYVEPCGGAASVLLQKPRSPLETYNDIDGDVVNFFRVLRDQPDELIRRIRLTPWAREEYENARTASGDDIERARLFFVSGWMSISGAAFEKSTGWRSTSFDGQSFSSHLWQFEYCKDVLQIIADRLIGIQIEHTEAAYVIERYGSTADTLIYFDPPYVQVTRTAIDQYRFEVDSEFHVATAELLRRTPAYVIVSGYECDLYRDLYEAHGWQRYDVKSQGNTGSERVESLWLSPRTADALTKPKQASLLEAA